MGILDAPAIPLVQKGAALGVATLDGSGTLTATQLPALSITDVFTVGSQAAMLALTAQRGDVALRTDLDPNQTFILAADNPTVLANWKRATLANVASVNGRVGSVVLGPDDVGALAKGVVVNVGDFGATGLGIADDTAAVTAAAASIDYNGELLFPRGRFRFGGVVVGSATLGQGRTLSLRGSGEFGTTLIPRSPTETMISWIGPADASADASGISNLNIDVTAARAYDVPVISHTNTRYWTHEKIRVLADQVTGTVFRHDGSYEGSYRDVLFRTGKWAVPVEFINETDMPSIPGSFTQMDTVTFDRVTVMGCIGVVARNARNEMHGFNFVNYKVVNTVVYGNSGNNNPGFETKLTAPIAVGDTQFSVATTGVATQGLGIIVGDCVVVDYSAGGSGGQGNVEFAKVTAVNTVTGLVTVSQPFRWAHDTTQARDGSTVKDIPVFVGGLAASFGDAIHTIHFTTPHFEGHPVAIGLGNVRSVVIDNAYCGASDLFVTYGNAREIYTRGGMARGSSVRNRWGWRPAYAIGISDGQVYIQTPPATDSSAPNPFPAYYTHSTRDSIINIVEGTRPHEWSNTNTPGTFRRRRMTNNGVTVAEEFWSGQARFTDGVQTKHLSGAGRTTVVDGDFTVAPTDGTQAVLHDTTTGVTRYAVRSAGAWLIIDPTALAAATTAETARAQAAEAALIPLTQRGAANGVATLDGSGVIPTSQIPALALGTAVTVASQAAMLALTAAAVQPGDLAVRTDGAGTFILTAADPSVLANWTRLNAPTDVVTSINGQVGTVVLAAADVGADASGAAAAALAAAVPKSLVDAKGDLLIATANDTPARLAVGADGTRLEADSTTAEGVKWATTYVAQALEANLLTTGEETVIRDGVSVGASFASGSLRLTYFTARKTETVTQLQMHTLGTAGATLTLARMGIYSVAANGDLTLIASIANDTTLFTATSTKYTRTLSANWAKVRGTRYAFGVLVVGTTMPLLAGIGAPATAAGDGPRRCGALASQTDLPANVGNATVAASGAVHYGVMLP